MCAHHLGYLGALMVLVARMRLQSEAIAPSEPAWCESAVQAHAKPQTQPMFLSSSMPRCDLFFQGPSVPHDEKLLAQLVERAHAYAQAGADGLFLPGLTTISLITELTKKSTLAPTS